VTRPCRLFVPGRLEVFGKHTDYAGGRSLVAAVPRGLTVTAGPVTGGTVMVRDTVAQQEAGFAADGTGPSDGWLRYPQAVIRRLARNFPDNPLAARIEFSSDLPQAAGISSSSALVIALAEALVACSAIDETDAWRSAISSDEDRAAYFGCIENGASFRTLAGDAGVGTHGGSEDHAAILMSRAGHLHQFSFSPLRLDRAVRMPEGWTFAVASTGIAARKAGEARRDYNLAAAAAREIVKIAVAAGFSRPEPPPTGCQREPALADLAIDPAAMRRIALPPDLRARLDHFVAEDGRVPEAAAAFERSEIERIEALADASHRDAERLLGNQIPETTDLVKLARQLGAAAASSFGAGWGGSVWALVRSPDAGAFLSGWTEAYRARHPGLRPAGFVSPPSAGVRRM